MSYQTRSTGGGWVNVSGPVDYAGVVSSYAANFIQAQNEQRRVEMEGKILDYQNGNITYDQLKDYLTGVLGKSEPGTQQELDIRKTISEVDKYENNKNREIKRAQLEEKYAKNGLSAAERATIEKEMLKYYKKGTPEYSQQLATIAEAKELQRQEDKNIKLSELESRLSEGGLTPREQIQVFEEALRLTDRGTKEYLELQTKLNELRQDDRKNQLMSSLLDQYASGGLTNDELLNINRQMQSLTERGTPEYIDLKQQEASLLGAGGSGGGAGGGGIGGSGRGVAGTTMDKNSAIATLESLDTQLQDLESRFQTGSMPVEEYLSQRSRIYAEKVDLLDGLGDLVNSDRTLSRYKGELGVQAKAIGDQEKLYSEGKAVTLVDGKGNQAIVSLEEAPYYAEEFDIANPDGTTETAGVITVNINGETKKFQLTEDGKYELLQDRDGVLTKTGLKMDTIKGAQGAIPKSNYKDPFALAGGPEIRGPSSGQIARGVADNVRKVAQTALPAALPGLQIPMALRTASQTRTGQNLINTARNQASTAVSRLTSIAPRVNNAVRSAASNVMPRVNTSNVLSNVSRGIQQYARPVTSFANSVVSAGRTALSGIRNFFGF